MHVINFYLRMFLAGVWFFAVCLASICMLPFRWKDPSMGALLGRGVNWGGTKIFGMHVHIENKQVLYSAQPCVYVANHQSNMDIVTMGSLYPTKTVVIGKKELKWFPLFGIFFVGAGNIMIDRKDRANSVAGLEAARDDMKKRGVSVWIFPEGTRNRGAREMLPFKKGAFHLAIAAQVPIVPIVHQHLFTYFSHATKRIPGGDIQIKVLEPVSTKGMTADDLPRLMSEVRSRMEAGLLSLGNTKT